MMDSILLSLVMIDEVVKPALARTRDRVSEQDHTVLAAAVELLEGMLGDMAESVVMAELEAAFRS